MLSIGVIMICFGGLSAQDNFKIKANLEYSKKDDLVVVKARVNNKQSIYIQELNYFMLALKKGASGNYSKSDQSGYFSLAPNEEKLLATIQQNIQEGELLKIYLFIKKGKLVIAKDSVEISLIEVTNQNKPLLEDDIEITGLVIEEMRTKMGKDFYDFFHQRYQSQSYKFNFYIFIKEKPTFGRSSIITIQIDDRTIFEFRPRADEEYLRKAALVAFNRVLMYHKQRRALFKLPQY